MPPSSILAVKRRPPPDPCVARESRRRSFRSLVATAGFPSRSWLQGRLKARKSRQLCRKWALRVSSDKRLAPRGVCLSLAPFTLAVRPSSVRPWRRGDVPDGSNRRGNALMHSQPLPPVDHFGQESIGTKGRGNIYEIFDEAAKDVWHNQSKGTRCSAKA